MSLSMKASEGLPPDLSKQIELIDTALGGHLNMGPEKLQSFALGMSNKVSDVEENVDAFIRKARLPSPVGTFLISEKAFSSLKEDPLLQTALVLRVLRYVSPKPWGSLQAQGKRRMHRLDELVSRLQNPITRTTPPFAMGSEVLWKPVISRARKLKNLAESAPRPLDVIAWLACRQPPDAQTAHATADVDLTESLLGAFAARKSGSGPKHFESMYDCRFLIRMDLDALPEELISNLSAFKSRIILNCESTWFYPRVSLQTEDRMQLLHDEITPSSELSSQKRTTWKPKGQGTTAAVDWINITFIRTLK
ncbi:hypothetical protein EST38_g6873 [Candolleomyces aberdarensis]|uniref:Uncharacterized protein n=1 Tax=Candolleomyces aberdarensis TaxID=2316362 RepID=A0A4Q2DGK8_9AGAR|nr:hypothetical protein EST38_g6873 [Candolleomyces aberdarensis]